MKKAVLLVAALLVCSSFAFADIGIGAWGRGFFVPLVSGGDDIYMVNQASWWTSPPRIGFTISGTSDNVGVQLDFNADGIFQPTTDDPALTPGDQQKIWVKLFDMLTIQIGNIYDDTLRGNAVLPAWDWIRFLNMDGEDLIFSRVGIKGTADTEISLAPVEGLYIYAALYGLNEGAYQMVEDAMTGGQYGAGYTIADIGTIRVQYIGESTAGGNDGWIEAAFKLTAVPGLTVDVGGKIPVDSTDYAAGAGAALPDELDAMIGVFASYTMDALTLMLEGSVWLWSNIDMGFEVGVAVNYSLDGGIGLTGEVSYQSEEKAGMLDGQISVLLGATMGFSNGLIGIGIEGSTGTLVGMPPQTDPDAFVWAIPIRMEYWF